MKTKSALIQSFMAAGVLSLACLTTAQAVPTITLTATQPGPNNTTITSATITIADNGANDLNPAAGGLAYTGSLGVFTFTLSTGLTKPLAGSAATPMFSLSENASYTGTGTLTVSFSETSFGPSNGSFTNTLGGGSVNGSVNAKYYDSLSNSLFGQGTLLSNLNGTGPNFSVSQLAGPAPASQYSLTQVVVISATGGGQTSFTATTTVPDGGSTIALLGLTLMGAEGVRRLATKRSAASAI